MPGARRLIRLCENQGTTLGIVSNAQFYTPLLFSALVGKSLPKLGLPDATSVWSYRMRAAKPSTCLFEEALSRLGLPAQSVVYVGNDCLNDVWTARECGLRTVLFAGDRRSLRRRATDPRCQNLVPDAVITELAQLPALLSTET